jgi:hypothetical protein
MTRTTKVALLTLCLVLAVSSVSATAFTSITLDRDASVDVVADDAGLVALEAGPSPLVTQQDGQLDVDVTNGGAAGTNVNAVLSVGENTTSPTESAFTVTNNAATQHTLTFAYGDVTADSATSTDNVRFAVYDASGNLTAYASESADATFTMGAGETYQVVLVVDTLDSTTTDDLSGTLTITSE